MATVLKTMSSPYQGVSKIQKMVRTHQLISRHVDPFTLDAVQPPIFRYINVSTNYIHYVSAEPFIAFIQSTGDVRCPFDRVELNKVQLRQLSKLGLACGILRVPLQYDVLRMKWKRNVEQTHIMEYFTDWVGTSIQTGIDIAESHTLGSVERFILLRYWICSVRHRVSTMLEYMILNETNNGLEEFRHHCIDMVESSRSCGVLKAMNYERLFPESTSPELWYVQYCSDVT